MSAKFKEEVFMPIPAEVEERLGALRAEWRTGDLSRAAHFFDANVDFRSPRGIVRGWEEISKTAGEWLLMRATAETVSAKPLPDNMALVDSVFETEKGIRNWFTEILHKTDKDYQIVSFRVRVGTSTASFEGLSKLSPQTVSDAVPVAVQNKEAEALRSNFKNFRAAFNKGDTKGVVALCTHSCDAIPVFSFLQGRAQILTGQPGIEAKGNRMFGVDVAQEVSNPNPNRQGAAYLGGEPKVLRFLSGHVAVVDGTAEITNIPSAHGFAPRELKGVYSTVWVKTSGNWLAEGAGAWF